MSEHAPDNAMTEPDEIARFYDRCSDLMRALLDELARTPGEPRPFPAIEDALGWPHRRIAAVLGGAGRTRMLEFGGRRPYHFHDERQSRSGRWELWMDAGQAGSALSMTDEEKSAEQDQQESKEEGIARGGENTPPPPGGGSEKGDSEPDPKD